MRIDRFMPIVLRISPPPTDATVDVTKTHTSTVTRDQYTRRITHGLVALVVLLATSHARADLRNQLLEIIRSADLGQTKIALAITDLDSGRELAALDADEPMIPASNMKLVTTAAALHLLGPDHAFRTTLRLIQPDQQPDTPPSTPELTPDHPQAVTNPTAPDLVIHGSGDPGFCDPTLLKTHNLDAEQVLGMWVAVVQETDLNHIHQIYVDDRIFDTHFVHPGWPKDQLNMSYCAQVAGLNFNGNCLDVYAKPTHPGEAPRVQVLPQAPFLTHTNNAVTGNRDTFWVSRTPLTNELTFWGSVKHHRHHPLRVTLHDPPIFLGKLLADRLNQHGVHVDAVLRPEPDQHLPQGRTLHIVRTLLPPLLRRCNKDSQNLFAEALLKRMGQQITATPGSWENGRAATRIFLRQLLGSHGAAATIADGSGLGQDNRLTARLLVKLLSVMHADPQRNRLFQDSLAIGGVDGTLIKRFKRLTTARVYAKSGYIQGVSALSGYLIIEPDTPAADPHHQTIAFSLLFNNIKPPIYVHHIKELQETILRFVVDQATPEPAATP